MPDVLGPVLNIGGRILIALVILLVTWLVARGVRTLFEKLVGKVGFLQRAGSDGKTLGETFGKIAALLVWLFGLIAVLQVFALQEVLAPLQVLLGEVMSYLPNLVAAVFVFVIGAVLAKVIRQLIETGLRAVPFEKWFGRQGTVRTAGNAPLPGTGPSQAAPQQGQPHPQAQQGRPQSDQPAQQGVGGPATLSERIANVVAIIVYALIMIVVSIAALQILGIAAISDPASMMLQAIFVALPRILAALLLLGLGVLIAKFVGDVLKQVLEGLGADNALTTAKVLPEGTNVTQIVTRIAQVAIVLFFAVMAGQVLAFPQVTQLLQELLVLGGRVLFGGVIIAAGFFLANLIVRLMNGGMAATIVKWVTIVLFIAMGLRSMGIADSIIELGFGAVVVGGALAAALAFGLGGREVAGRTLEKLENKTEEIVQQEAAEAESAASPATSSSVASSSVASSPAAGSTPTDPTGPTGPTGPTDQGGPYGGGTPAG